MVENHVILATMHKSGTLFLREALRLSADLEFVTICNPGPMVQQIAANSLWDFLETPRAQAGQHMPASNFNIEVLRQAGIKKATVTMRDPRDVVVSWWHYLYKIQNDPRSLAWHHAMLVAHGMLDPRYFELPRHEALSTLLETYLPRLLQWCDGWVSETRIDVQIIRYEEMIQAETDTVASILQHHGVNFDRVVLPEKSGTTNYRRGVPGSHRDEMTESQQERANSIIAATSPKVSSDTPPL